VSDVASDQSIERTNLYLVQQPTGLYIRAARSICNDETFDRFLYYLRGPRGGDQFIGVRRNTGPLWERDWSVQTTLFPSTHFSLHVQHTEIELRELWPLFLIALFVFPLLMVIICRDSREIAAAYSQTRK
jgi:hypothetical protein